MTVGRKLHVGLFLNDLNKAGGIQRVAMALARDLRTDFDMCLITMFPGQRVFREPWVEHHSLDLPFNPDKFYPSGREMIVLAQRLRRVVKERQLDVVICFWFHLAIVGALALPRSVIRIGYEHIAFATAGGWWGKLRRWSYPWLDSVVILAESEAVQFAQTSRHVEVIPNYVTLPCSIDFQSREKIILAVGHIEYRKGLDRLLSALQEPLQANPGWRLVFVGGGETGVEEQWYITYLHSLLVALNLKDRVALYPATPRISAWYRRASILVMGSRAEGFPLVLLEGKAHGLPIVAFDCPTGPKEIVRHETDGFLVDNEADFARAANSLMGDASLRWQMGQNAVEDVRNRFLREQICRRWRDLIVSLSEKRG